MRMEGKKRVARGYEGRREGNKNESAYRGSKGWKK